MTAKKAFTLIELLVVVSIIALLVAILLPALNKAREQGQRAVCLNNLKSILLANSIYAAENDDYCVPLIELRRDGDVRIWMSNPDFRNYIGYKDGADFAGQSWVQTPEDFQCPSDMKVRDPSKYAYNNDPTRPDRENTGTLVSYGYNFEDWFPSDGRTWSLASTDAAGYRLARVRRPAECLFFNEGDDWWSRWKGADYLNGWDVLRQKGSVNDYKAVGCGGPTMYRHNEGTNLAFYDGHVEYRLKFDVWFPQHWYVDPADRRPEIWVANLAVWNTYR